MNEQRAAMFWDRLLRKPTVSCAASQETRGGRRVYEKRHMRTVELPKKSDTSLGRCFLCPHECVIKEGNHGICGVRKNINGQLIAESYGQITSVALDPIEKKPLYMFHPGTMILSVGSYGCNFRCPFCQNHGIAMPKERLRCEKITPEGLVAFAQKAVAHGNIGVAYTYNEPLIGYEFVYDCAKLVRDAGLKNVLVTNGFISEEPLETILPYIDAMNIDLKGFASGFYQKIGGDLEAVKAVIKRASESCHVEVTTLVIPGENDGDVEEIAKWLADVDASIPLHLSRFFPRNEYKNREPTPREMVLELKEVAGRYLEHVFVGNV